MDFKKLQMDAVNPIAENQSASGQEDISEIFSAPQPSTAQIADEKQIKEIPIENIIPSKHNKFDRYSGEKKEAMIDSIRENGILSPLTLRKIDKPDIYEIISGENRWICAKEAGKTTVPAYTLDCSEEDAIMYLTEANLINRDISFRERIIAYRQQYDVMKLKSGERSDLQNDGGEKIDSLDILAKKYGESKTQMHRYIRTAELSDELINAVGAKKIALDAAPKFVGRTCEDIDEAVISYAELKAVASGDERIKEKMDVDLEVSRLQMLKANYDNQRYTLQDKFTFQYPKSIAENEKRLEGLTMDKATRDSNHSEEFSMVISGKEYTEREEAGKRLMLIARSLPKSDEAVPVGTYSGFELKIKKQSQFSSIVVNYILSGERDYSISPSESNYGNTLRLDNVLKGIEDKITKAEQELADDKRNLELAKVEYEKPFAYSDELEQKLQRQAELNKELDLDKKDDVIVSEDDEEYGDAENTGDNSDSPYVIPYSNLEKQNYILLQQMFPEIISGVTDDVEYRCKNYDNLNVRRIGLNMFAVCVYYMQDGDKFKEPEYTFKIDKENKAARIMEWTMSSLKLYRYVGSDNDPERYDRALKKDLDETFNETLKDIRNINYELCSVDEDSDEDDIEM